MLGARLLAETRVALGIVVDKELVDETGGQALETAEALLRRPVLRCRAVPQDVLC
jgi:hypothetical protein